MFGADAQLLARKWQRLSHSLDNYANFCGLRSLWTSKCLIPNVFGLGAKLH
jgi:hypothetical protein